MVEHTCEVQSEDCPACLAQAQAEAAHLVRSARGRWLTVFEGGGAVRLRGRRDARAMARLAIDAGVPARVIRYRRDRVRFDDALPGLEVIDLRWWPAPWGPL